MTYTRRVVLKSTKKKYNTRNNMLLKQRPEGDHKEIYKLKTDSGGWTLLKRDMIRQSLARDLRTQTLDWKVLMEFL